ncbi:putative membrane protein [Wickerhamomyces ciferrii]|uniref:Membrane protein n=1 Tax=Wickerhamomyces ciferrii (strain ATCC 14091 / BCRC 22168 / CBS 111 / JCM 3599 / NBRC 0793 / NRRL Y-1031 F-60-10) TaxID=1206466 RepID=K0KKX1_WICCF|nr:uncharacterized protein BN7_5447 [Wickerhamomyces ciferrii]CCH45860.1 putative membrane protein [Wickerhamomyces ciferrii]
MTQKSESKSSAELDHKNDQKVGVKHIVDGITSDEDDQIITEKHADVTLKLFEEYEASAGELTPELERRIKWKLWTIILPIVFFVNFMLFLDKNAMGYASLLGLFEDADLDQQKYNDLQTIFYAGYILFQLPSHWAFQKFKLSHYISAVTVVWTITTFTTLSVKDFGHLAAIRFFLGAFESGVTAAIQHTIAMWFTPAEQAIVNPIFWISCIAQGIPGGLTAYGTQFVPSISPWKVYWIIIGGLSAILSISSFFFYPDNPATYKYFTVQERIHVIKRIKAATHSSIEQKTFKKAQAIEGLKDPITWLFGIYVFLSMLCNNISFQSAIIYKNLGFSNLNSTLVSVASSGWTTIASIWGSLCLVYFRTQSAHVGTFFALIALLGGIIAVAIPFRYNYGILAGIFLTNSNANTFIMAFSWSQSSAAGYSKRLIRTVIWSVFYGASNLAAPQIWKAKDKPRYRPAWIIMIICSWFLAPLILQVIRFILARRNKQRLQLLQDIKDGKIEDPHGFITSIDEEGNKIKTEVDVSMLDLTDWENKKFIYPL